jgi:hypothetical protein
MRLIRSQDCLLVCLSVCPPSNVGLDEILCEGFCQSVDHDAVICSLTALTNLKALKFKILSWIQYLAQQWVRICKHS